MHQIIDLQLSNLLDVVTASCHPYSNPSYRGTVERKNSPSAGRTLQQNGLSTSKILAAGEGQQLVDASLSQLTFSSRKEPQPIRTSDQSSFYGEKNSRESKKLTVEITTNNSNCTIEEEESEENKHKQSIESFMIRKRQLNTLWYTVRNMIPCFTFYLEKIKMRTIYQEITILQVLQCTLN